MLRVVRLAGLVVRSYNPWEAIPAAHVLSSCTSKSDTGHRGRLVTAAPFETHSTEVDADKPSIDSLGATRRQ